MRVNIEAQPEVASSGAVRSRLGPIGWVDVVLVAVLVGAIGGVVYLAGSATGPAEGVEVSLSPQMLPLYTALSIGRLLAAYVISILFSIAFGYAAASSKRAERILLPTLDVLQSTPITSFLPAVLLGFAAIMPARWAAEAASVVLIVTCQAWNIGFAWYQALTTAPPSLSDAATVFRFNGWLRFKSLQLPFAAVSLIWNSMVSWANGWFFLMVAEMLRLGGRDFRLLGLGSYLQEAANQGNAAALGWGIVTLLVVIVALDQLVWRPLLAWSARFVPQTDEEEPPRAWFHDLLRTSRLIERLTLRVERAVDALDRLIIGRFPARRVYEAEQRGGARAGLVVAAAVLAGAAWGLVRSGHLLTQVSAAEWWEITVGIGATFVRVVLALLLSLAWTLPVGVAIGTRPRLAARFQPIVQLAASVPATALFPAVLWLIPHTGLGLNIAGVALMVAGTQWYLLFNILAGASSIPAEMHHSTALLGLSRWQRWRYLILPSLLPNLVTGAVVATGGAWNVCVVAEYVQMRGQILEITGAGATIQHAAAVGNYPLLLAATLALVVVVVLVNRTVWGRLYALASDRYRLE